MSSGAAVGADAAGGPNCGVVETESGCELLPRCVSVWDSGPWVRRVGCLLVGVSWTCRDRLINIFRGRENQVEESVLKRNRGLGE